MSRFVDSVVPPQNPLPKQVIVLSLGRNGTVGLWKALKVLGYKSYHMTDTIGSIAHMKMFREALEPRSFGRGEPWKRHDFDKWLGDYDALTDIPGYLAEELVAAYPEALFILTTRDEDAWCRSVKNTFQPVGVALKRFPLAQLRHISAWTSAFSDMADALCAHLWGPWAPQDSEGLEYARQLYQSHNAKVVELVPSDRLLVVRLEDGLSWDPICPFLGKPVPDVPYPRENDPKQYMKTTYDHIYRGVATSAIKTLPVLIPVLGVLIWYF
ncbi:hypothetical protein G7Z17_g9222 [Cylindrodendrum hubeiense]|uniref:P-loop containing nucleoside triphosphate hydrolase protein n=1 Tax=Cylindrodendrum hubeiense TaxID=595255 RepID=A0A9P5LCF4_9HYPO|nr:hypothetical protein G7Z17_g9222 [Cylindrodendrum hubeiense]